MKPEEMLKKHRISALATIVQLIKQKPNEVFGTEDVQKETGMPLATARTAISKIPKEYLMKHSSNGKMYNILGTPKALAKFKSLLP